LKHAVAGGGWSVSFEGRLIAAHASAPGCPFGGANADKVTLHIGQAAAPGDHQAPGAGAGIGPRLREGTELPLGIDDLPICLTMANRSKVERARRSMRVTVTMSPGARAVSNLRSSRQSLYAPVTLPRRFFVFRPYLTGTVTH